MHIYGICVPIIGNYIPLQAFIQKGDPMNIILELFHDKINGTFTFLTEASSKSIAFRSFLHQEKDISSLSRVHRLKIFCLCQSSDIISHVENMAMDCFFSTPWTINVNNSFFKISDIKKAQELADRFDSKNLCKQLDFFAYKINSYLDTIKKTFH